MRALVILCLTAGTAGAEVTLILDSELAVQPFPRISASIGVMGTGGKLAGLDLTGWAPNVELALGSGHHLARTRTFEKVFRFYLDLEVGAGFLLGSEPMTGTIAKPHALAGIRVGYGDARVEGLGAGAQFPSARDVG